MLNKRALGVANHVLKRSKRFEGAAGKLQCLADFAQAQSVEWLLCTGDYTALGTPPEYEAALRALAPLLALDVPMATVPGNHDLYMPDTTSDRRFERFFGQFLHNDLPELGLSGQSYPWVRLVGSELALIGVNSARPNPQPWRSSGRIPQAELDALTKILADPRVASRFVLILTHYAPRRADGRHDSRSHGLENVEAFLEVCRRGLRRGAVLHGHIHQCYSLDVAGVRTFGAGSATDLHKEGFWLFEVDADCLRATPGEFVDGRYQLRTAGQVVLR